MSLLNKSLATRNTELTRATRIVTYLTPEEVRQLESAALTAPRKGERDALLIRVLFQTGLRISEALTLTPKHVELFEGRPSFSVIGKGNKPRRVACPVTLAESLQAYAFRHQLASSERYFALSQSRPAHTGSVHRLLLYKWRLNGTLPRVLLRNIILVHSRLLRIRVRARPASLPLP